MARIVLAGTADCPHLARAEQLAERLQASLPAFRVRRLLLQPDEWKGWLQYTCRANGWQHSGGSPLVWRELVGRGGRGLLLGGLDDFLQHCQEYYGVASDMSSEVALKIGAENREAEEKRKEEAELQASLLQPIHVWIAGALNPTCPILIPHLLSEQLFPSSTPTSSSSSTPTSSSSSSSVVISLHLLHLEGDEEVLHALRMETEDLALPHLHQVPDESFHD